MAAGEADRIAVCPACRAEIPVEPEWRIASCPRCGATVTRMGDDARFD
ncbi:MAG TPA: hypothetical protein VMH78_06150 [Thermoplasmata archaeon]|nr:hypothetical protein [Thermoplasmata archaeon]